MKKLIAITAVVLMFTGNIFAKNPRLELIVKDNKVLVIELEGVEEGSFLQLKNLAGEVLYKIVLEKETYEAALDFKVIPIGTYFLEYENDQYIRTSIIEKTRNGLKIIGTPKVVFKPSFKVEGKKVVVFLTNHQQNTTSLTIMDAEGTVVGKLKDTEYTFTRTLDFSEMPAGEYVLIVKSGKNSFQHKVNLG